MGGKGCDLSFGSNERLFGCLVCLEHKRRSMSMGGGQGLTPTDVLVSFIGEGGVLALQI